MYRDPLVGYEDAYLCLARFSLCTWIMFFAGCINISMPPLDYRRHEQSRFNDLIYFPRKYRFVILAVSDLLIFSMQIAIFVNSFMVDARLARARGEEFYVY